MPVVNPIIFKVTEAGRDAAAYAFNNLPGGKLSLSAIKVGLAKYSTVGNETALQNPLPNTFSIGGGGVQAGSGQIRFTPILASTTRIEAFEIGLFTETGILFAVAATPTNIPLLVIEPDIEAIFTMNVALTNVDPDSIEIVVDVNSPLAVVMMGQHISAAHPHSQYKRTLDNTEQLKIANGTDNDHAVSKNQLDGAISTEAGTRADADTALQTAINAETEAREDYLKRAGLLGHLIDTRNMPNNANLNNYFTENGKWYFTNSQFNRPFDFGVLEVILIDDERCIQHAVSLFGKEASRYFDFNASNIFTDWVYRANGNGDNTLRFAVADAVNADEAISKGQLDGYIEEAEDKFEALGLWDALHDRDIEVTGDGLNDYIESGKWYFSEENYVSPQLPFPFGVLEVLRVAPDEVYQKVTSQGREALRHKSLNVWSDWRFTASQNGDHTKRFKVADAVENNEAINKGQLITVPYNGTTYTSFTGYYSNFVLAAKQQIRVILIGAGGGGGGVGHFDESFNDGVDGGDSVIYPDGNTTGFFLKAKGGQKGTSANYTSSSSYTTGANGNGGEVEINNFYDVVILSYQNGQKGNFNIAPPTLDHPVAKNRSISYMGQGGKGGGYYFDSVAGSGGSGAFVEALIRNNTNDPITLVISCPPGGAGGSGFRGSGDDGNDGYCIIIHD